MDSMSKEELVQEVKRLQNQLETHLKEKKEYIRRFKELLEKNKKLIDMNIEFKQKAQEYYEKDLKRKRETPRVILQNPPCPVKKRKTSFPDVPEKED